MSGASEATPMSTVLPTHEPLAVADCTTAEVSQTLAAPSTAPFLAQGFPPLASVSNHPQVDPSVTHEVIQIPTGASSLASVGFSQPSYCIGASVGNANESSGAGNSSSPDQQSIPLGAVTIRHTGNIVSHLSKRRRGKIPNNIRIFRRGMSQPAFPTPMPPQPQPGFPTPACPPSYPRPEQGAQAGGSASNPAKRRGRPPGSGKKPKLQAPTNLDG